MTENNKSLQTAEDFSNGIQWLWGKKKIHCAHNCLWFKNPQAYAALKKNPPISSSYAIINT